MSILSSPLVAEGILPFVLVFVLVFAILQKSRLLGEGKTQIDAIVGIIIGFMTIIVPSARNFVITIVPFLGVGLAIILVYLILFGLVANGEWNAKWVKIVFGILAGIFVIAVVLYSSGYWPDIKDYFSSGSGSELWTTILFLIIVAAAIIAVIVGKKKS